MTDCVMHQSAREKHCWEVEGTLCSSLAIEHIITITGEKVDFCRRCIYYNYVKAQSVIK